MVNIGTGFGFLTFESEESVDRCCSEHFVNINGKQVLKTETNPTTTTKKIVTKSHANLDLANPSKIFDPGDCLRNHQTANQKPTRIYNQVKRKIEIVFRYLYTQLKNFKVFLTGNYCSKKMCDNCKLVN